jgi:hypothetical protein
MSRLTNKFKPRRRSKLRLPNIEKLSCRSKEQRLMPKKLNLPKVAKQLPKKNRSRSKQRKLLQQQKKEVMKMKLPDSKLLVTKKHKRLLKLK